MKKRFTLAGLSAEEASSSNPLSSCGSDSDSDFYSSDDDEDLHTLIQRSETSLARSMAVMVKTGDS